jgi:transposase
MYVKVTRSGPRRYVQLVESFRDEAGKVKQRTITTLGRLDVRQFGMAKEGLIARQVMLGVVQTGDGLPIYHEVFAANTAESPTSLPTLKTVLERFASIRRVVLVADRGLLSLDNLEALSEIRLQSGEPLEFVLAVPGRRYSEFAELLDAFQAQCADAEREIVGELPWRNLRLVVAHNPEVAREIQALRRERIEALEEQANTWFGKLDARDAGVKARGKKLSDSGAKARLYHAVKDAHLANIIRVDLKSELFAYEIDHDALALAELMDGKLVTNTPDLSPQGVVDRYKSLADFERGFRVLKSEIKIGPVFHRLSQRIKAHAAICFMALILYRIMRLKLKAANNTLSPERALESLRRIQRHRIQINGDLPVEGISTITDEQARLFQTLGVQKPFATQQMPLL